MTFEGDPYRILGLVTGASPNEIRSAYRRLAKQYHPDTAGERALPRFLAIQAAYERLVDAEGRLRASGRQAGPRPDPREPWRADPERARASRNAWRARREAGSDSGSSSAGAGARASGERSRPPSARSPRAGSAGARSSGSRPAGSAGTGAGPDTPRGERNQPRGPRKATPGSTTYDEAAEAPRDPAWTGGSWYGPSSGTYWTINPREYADPRKHGPEYLERARRVSPATDGVGADARWQWSGFGSTPSDGGAAEWGAGSWVQDDGSSRSGPGTNTRPDLHDAMAETQPNVRPFRDLESLARRISPRNLLRLARRSDRRWRVLLATVAWPPVGLAVGAVLSALTGCSTASTVCPEPMSMLPLIAQPFVVAGLFLAAPVAAVAAFASLVALAVAVPANAVLSVGTLPGSRSGAWVLGTLVVFAWLFALVAGGVAVATDPTHPGDAPPGP